MFASCGTLITDRHVSHPWIRDLKYSFQKIESGYKILMEETVEDVNPWGGLGLKVNPPLPDRVPAISRRWAGR